MHTVNMHVKAFHGSAELVAKERMKNAADDAKHFYEAEEDNRAIYTRKNKSRLII